MVRSLLFQIRIHHDFAMQVGLGGPSIPQRETRMATRTNVVVP